MSTSWKGGVCERRRLRPDGNHFGGALGVPKPQKYVDSFVYSGSIDRVPASGGRGLLLSDISGFQTAGWPMEKEQNSTT